MEENLSQAITMTFLVFLFVFALSNAVMRYNAMNDTAETMISINVVNRRGTAVDSQLQASDIKREADYGEIALAALNMEDNILKSNGNNKYTIEVRRYALPTVVLSYTEPSGDVPGIINLKVNSAPPGELKFYTSDIAGTSAVAFGTENFLTHAKEFFGVDKKYNVSFTENKIIYQEV